MGKCQLWGLTLAWAVGAWGRCPGAEGGGRAAAVRHGAGRAMGPGRATVGAGAWAFALIFQKHRMARTFRAPGRSAGRW